MLASSAERCLPGGEPADGKCRGPAPSVGPGHDRGLARVAVMPFGKSASKFARLRALYSGRTGHFRSVQKKRPLPEHARSGAAAGAPAVPSQPNEVPAKLTLFQANLLVAMLAGFWARKADGHPGPDLMG